MLMPLRPARLALSVGWCRLLALCLICGAGAAHLAYLAHDCPLDLAPDEAHYWDWSRHLDWSYYSKGPLIAYLIRGGCELAGPWAVAHTGNLALAVRLPAVLCGSLLLLSLYVLTVQVYRRETLALGRRRHGPDAAGHLRRLVAHDHRRSVHLLLGLGAGAGPSGHLPRLDLGLAAPRRGAGAGHVGQVHHDRVDSIGRAVSADDAGVSASAVAVAVSGAWSPSPACAVCRSSSGTPSTIG